MHAMIAGLVKQVVAKAVLTKATKEIAKITEETDDSVTGVIETVEVAVVSKKKVAAWIPVITALVYFLSAQGYITPEIAELLNSILSNPETVDALENIAN